MSKLISLVSDQTIPNVLLIKELDAFDEYIFLSTNRMEEIGQSTAIIKTCGLSRERCEIIIVVEDDFNDIANKLNTLQFADNERIVVNITGGTKVMSLAVFTQLQLRRNIEFKYKTMGSYEFKDSRNPQSTPINVQLTVRDYLSSYGISYTAKPKTIKSEEHTLDFFEKYVNGNVNRDVIEQLRRNYRSTRRRSFAIDSIENPPEENGNNNGPQIPQLSTFLADIGFQSEEQGHISRDEIKYLTGDWMEEYVYFLIKRLIPNADVETGVNLRRGDRVTENELDVVFCIKDNLCIVECKTSMFDEDLRYKLFNDTVYKLRAVSSKSLFGLSANAYLFTLDELNDDQLRVMDRAGVMGIKLAHRAHFLNEEEMKKIVPSGE